MNEIFFSQFSTFFKSVFINLDCAATIPALSAVFTFIYCMVRQKIPSVFLLNLDMINCEQLALTIHAQSSGRATILFQLIEQKKDNFNSIYVTIISDQYAEIHYQFALYTIRKLKKEIVVKPIGHQSTIHVIGKYIANAQSNFLCHTYQYHDQPHAESSVIVEGISIRHSSVVHKGFIHIAPSATGTKTKQSSRHIALSNTVAIHAQPVLDVENNNVSCAHASAIGTISKEAIFYLNTRGINKKDATLLLAYPFALFTTKRYGATTLHQYAKKVLHEALSNNQAHYEKL